MGTTVICIFLDRKSAYFTGIGVWPRLSVSQNVACVQTSPISFASRGKETSA